jgi:putative membrane protein
LKTLINKLIKIKEMKKSNFFDVIKTGILGISILLSVPAMSQQSPALSDPEVASAAVTANQIDIEYAQIAMAKSKNEEVLSFAKTLANDHKAVIDQAVALAGKLHVTPQSNYLTKKLLSDAESTKKDLQSKNGKAFDQAYIKNEVAYHKAVINAVENVLIPDTDNAELKSLLQNVVPTLKAHLSHAEMLQQKIAP